MPGASLLGVTVMCLILVQPGNAIGLSAEFSGTSSFGITLCPSPTEDLLLTQNLTCLFLGKAAHFHYNTSSMDLLYDGVLLVHTDFDLCCSMSTQSLWM